MTVSSALSTLQWPMANFGLDTAYTIATAGSEGFLNMLPSKPYSV